MKGIQTQAKSTVDQLLPGSRNVRIGVCARSFAQVEQDGCILCRTSNVLYGRPKSFALDRPEFTGWQVVVQELFLFRINKISEGFKVDGSDTSTLLGVENGPALPETIVPNQRQ